MATVSELIEKLEKQRANVQAAAGEAILANSPAIVQLLISQHTEQHIDSKGKPLPPYTRDYARFKAKRGLPLEPNIELTGALHRSIEISLDGWFFIMASPVSYQPYVRNWAANRGAAEIMDLTPENMQRVNEIISETFNEKLNSFV